MSRPIAKKHHYILEIQEATTGSSITITCASFRSQAIVAEMVQFLSRIGASINYVKVNSFQSVRFEKFVYENISILAANKSSGYEIFLRRYMHFCTLLHSWDMKINANSIKKICAQTNHRDNSYVCSKKRLTSMNYAVF